MTMILFEQYNSIMSNENHGNSKPLVIVLKEHNGYPWAIVKDWQNTMDIHGLIWL